LKPRLLANDGSKPLEILENGQVVWGRNPAGVAVCNSRLREKPGKRCGISKGLFKNGRCILHGGKSAAGLDHPQFKDGKTSRYFGVLPTALRLAVEEVQAAGDYLSLRADIEVTAARIRMALAEFGGLDQACIGKLLKQADFARELLDGEFDEEDLETSLRGLLGLLDELEGLSKAHAGLEKTQEHLRRMVETEGKLRAMEGEQISALKARALFELLCQCVRLNVWSFLRWLHTEFPEVRRHPGYFNPLEPIAAEANRLIGGPVQDNPPELPAIES
jgi:hypothetical protein